MLDTDWSGNQVEDLDVVVQARSGESEGLLQVLFLQIGIVEEQFGAVGVGSEQMQYATHGQAEAADTRLPPILPGSMVMRSKGGFRVMLRIL